MTKATLQAKTRNELLTLARAKKLTGVTTLRKDVLIERLLKLATTTTKKKTKRGTKAVRKPSARKKAAKTAKKTVAKVAAKKKAKPAAKKTIAKVAGKAKRQPVAKTSSGAVTVKKKTVGSRKPSPKPRSPKRPAVGVPKRSTQPALGKIVSTSVDDLPATYGSTRLTLLEVDERRLYAYWEISVGDVQAVHDKLGDAGRAGSWILRFYDTTYLEFDGTNAHSSFDVPVHLPTGNWYVELWSGGKTYCAEIGVKAANGQFAAAARSNFVQMPGQPPAPGVQSQEAMLNFETGDVTAVDPKQTAGDDLDEIVSAMPGDPAHQLQEQYRQWVSATVPFAVLEEGDLLSLSRPAGSSDQLQARVEAVGSSEAVASLGAGSAGFADAAGAGSTGQPMHAEVVVTGRARPRQRIQVNGQWVRAESDGSFKVHLALPVLPR